MVKVVNIKVEEIDFKKEKSAQFKKCLELVPNLLDFLPKRPKHRVTFELKETNADVANAIRRCIINEIPTKSLHYDMYKDTDISDPYILSDFLKKQIDLIPIEQDIDYTDYQIELYAENKTDEIIDVTTKDFIIKKNNKLDTNRIMSDVMVICRLRPEESVSIKNITIREGIGRDDAASFSQVSNIYYDILDVKPLDVDTGEGVSSMDGNPTHFMIGYSTHRNTNKPLLIVVKACDAIINRFEIILSDFKNISSKEDYYYSDLIQLETNGNIKEIQFKNENWTTINLMVRFCFLLTKGNTKFIVPSIIHPEKEVGVVRISHPEFSKLIQNVIKKIIEELNVIRKSFV
jgi:DNA-directed RNA polymerase subunit L